MNGISVAIITRSDELPPQAAAGGFFHGAALFRALEADPRQRPYMAVASDGGRVVAHMLVALRRRGSLLPPCLFAQGRIYGEGCYAPGCDREELFGLMLRAVVGRLRRRLCLYVEFSDQSAKMFGYGRLRSCGFFPVHWMEIHNSLHSRHPALRLTAPMRALLSRARRAGLEGRPAASDADYDEFLSMARGHARLRLGRFVPGGRFFRQLRDAGCCRLFVVTAAGGRTVGGSLCVYSGADCHLWYLASRPGLHMRRAAAVAVWTAAADAYARGCAHVRFMDVGLPFRRNRLRDFILGFGGKPVGTYRWFCCTIGWVNRILSWIYRE